MMTYRAYNTAILDHMVSHVYMRKQSKKLELKCYIQMKSKVNVLTIGSYNSIQSTEELVISKYKYPNLVTSEGIQINEENIN